MAYDQLLEEDVKLLTRLAANRGLVPHGEFVSKYLRGTVQQLDLVKRETAIRAKLQKLKRKGSNGSLWFAPTGEPTKDHWSLIFWAYSPAQKSLLRWLDDVST